MENENGMNNNNIDLNNNGVPDWYEVRVDDQSTFPEGDLGRAYTSEEKLAAKIPNYKDYKWYQNPVMDGHLGTRYFYTLGEKVEKAIENNPKEVKQTLNEIAKEDNGISKKDVQPLIKEAEQVTDGDERTSEVNNEVVNEVLENPKLEGLLDNVEMPYDNNDEVVSKADFDNITPEQLPENSDIQEEIEQLLYDNSPNSDEVSNEVVSKADFDKMPIDEIEQRDAESITEDKPYMEVANDMGLEEEDLFYFEQPEFIEDLTPEQVEEVKNEPDKQKKIELLKGLSGNYAQDNIGSIESSGGAVSNTPIGSIGGNSSITSINANPPVTSQVRKAGSFLSGVGTGAGGISAGSVSNFDFDDKSNNTVSKTGKGQSTDIEVSKRDANTASLNGANSVKHLDDSLDELGFKDTKHNQEIETKGQVILPNEEFHEKDKESFELKLPENPTNDDIILYLERDSVNWENGDSKSKYLPFRFFIKDGELWGTVIGHGKPEKIENFMKHEILAKGKISSIINQ